MNKIQWSKNCSGTNLSALQMLPFYKLFCIICRVHEKVITTMTTVKPGTRGGKMR